MAIEIVRKRDGYLARSDQTGAIEFLGPIDSLLWRIFRRTPPRLKQMDRRIEGVDVKPKG